MTHSTAFVCCKPNLRTRPRRDAAHLGELVVAGAPAAVAAAAGRAADAAVERLEAAGSLLREVRRQAHLQRLLQVMWRGVHLHFHDRKC